jgi:ABC-2 type transport system permease protein
MKKILLIAYRDFIIRIRNKTFLVSTLLLPIGIVLFYGTIFFFTSNDTDIHRIGVVDINNHLISKLPKDDNFQFIPFTGEENFGEKTTGEKYNIDAVVMVPETKESYTKGEFKVLTYTKIGIMTKSKFENIFQKIIETDRFSNNQIDSTKIEEIQKSIKLNYQSISGTEENDMKEGISYALSFGLGIMMYVILTIYGAQVMRGVMEEKTNRIVEIIISSVKPFELLMGKIIGIGMVSFLQLTVWGIFLGIINIAVGMVFGVSALSNPEAMASMPGSVGGAAQMAQNPQIIEALNNLQSINFLPIVVIFIFYFLGGYFLYSSLFASVGSAVGDDPQDVQSLMMPIMLPILLSFVFLSKSVNNPNCTEAVVASIVPFTAPVVMMSRVVFGIGVGVPLWQLLLSMAVMVITTVFFLFLAARIYKVGILLYGKKVGWMEMLKWVFIK